MKRLLSVLLALTMVLTSAAFAAPAAIGSVQRAEETTVEEADDMAMLSATTIARGINMLTGTKDPFDAETYTDYSWITQTNVSITDDPAGLRDGKVLTIEYPVGGTNSDYIAKTIDFGGDLDTDIGHSYIYLAFDYSKYVPSMEGYVPSFNFYCMNASNGASTFAPYTFSMRENEGWQHYGKVIDYSINESGNRIDDSTKNQYYNGQNINRNLMLHAHIIHTNEVPVYVSFDNFVIAPAYKVTYYDAQGENIVKEEFVVVDEEGNLLSSFSPENFLYGEKVYSNWSLTKGGSAVTDVALTENEDIVLYATTETDVTDVFEITFDKKLTKIGATATATAVLPNNPDLDYSKIKWTSGNTKVATVAYDNEKNIATVTAVGAGVANLTFSYDGTEFTDTVTVATTAATGNFAGLDADVYEYATVNVTNAGAATEIVMNYETEKGTGSVTIDVPANVTAYDVYADLTEENWGGNIVSVDFATGVTVNNKKLWAVLRTEPALELTADSDLIYEVNGTVTVTGAFACDLEGVYDEAFTITVDADSSVATYNVNGNEVTITGLADGVVTVTAASAAYPSVKAEKQILVSIKNGAVNTNEIGYKWDFNTAASRTAFGTASGHHNLSSHTDSSLKVVCAGATVNGTQSVYQFTEENGIVKLATPSGGYVNATVTKSNTVLASEHKYLVMKLRTNVPGTVYLTPYMKYSGKSDYIIPSISVAATEEYKTFVYDLSSKVESDAGYFTSMMFVLSSPKAYVTDTVDAATMTINKALSDLSWEGGEMAYVEFDEIYFANYDPTLGPDAYYGVNLTADKTTLDGDGTITLTPTVFSNIEITNCDVNYTVDDNKTASVLKNADGTATVTPLKNGTVTVTATAVVDPTASSSITLTFTNITAKTVAYDLKLMSIGNSYLEHGYLSTADKEKYNGFMAPTDIPRGMAATSPEEDYFHKICAAIQEGFNCTFVSKIQGGAGIEQAYKKGVSGVTLDREVALAAMRKAWVHIVEYMDKEQPNLITIQLAENAAPASLEIAEFFYDELYKVIDEHRPENSVVVVISPMGTSYASKGQKPMAEKYGFHWADNTWICDENGWGSANKYLAFEEYPDYTNASTVEFRTHPGNRGMTEIAKSAYALFEQYIPTSIEPKLVTLPETIEMSGPDAITAKGGTAEYTLDISPATATTDVYWSVDNENLATIEDGVLTAKLNGTVKVTAVCAYDDTIKAEKTVTISGQPQHYTLTYAAGTTDAVEGIPEAYEYAVGTYEFPELTAAPERTGYKFKGWALKENGAVVSGVDMTGAKTVYAVWEFADNWQFNNDSPSNDLVSVYLEGISAGGFNTNVKDGIMQTISYNDVAVSVSHNALLLPAELYKKFKIRVEMSEIEEGDEFTLTVKNSEGEESTYTATTLEGMNEYSFDISNNEGTITSFTFATSNSADGVGMNIDYIKFVKSQIKNDTVIGSYSVHANETFNGVDSLITFENLNIAEGVTFTLDGGNFEIGNLTGNGVLAVTPYTNVIVTGDTKPEGYVEVNIGAKAADENVRYFEVDGYQYKIANDTGVLGFVNNGKVLVEVTEKAAEDAITADSVKYYLVNGNEGTAAEVGLDNFMLNKSGYSIKIDEPSGIRFKAGVLKAAKAETENYTITEYGYIIAVESALKRDGAQLNFDYRKYVYGTAYNKAANKDIIFNNDDDNEAIFTAVLTNIPESKYSAKLVTKTYTKIEIDGSEYTVYGEPMKASVYTIAKALDAQGGLDSDTQTLVDSIVEKCEKLDGDIGLDYGDLWK